MWAFTIHISLSTWMIFNCVWSDSCILVWIWSSPRWSRSMSLSYRCHCHPHCISLPTIWLTIAHQMSLHAQPATYTLTLSLSHTKSSNEIPKYTFKCDHFWQKVFFVSDIILIVFSKIRDIILFCFDLSLLGNNTIRSLHFIKPFRRGRISVRSIKFLWFQKASRFF